MADCTTRVSSLELRPSFFDDSHVFSTAAFHRNLQSQLFEIEGQVLPSVNQDLQTGIPVC